MVAGDDANKVSADFIGEGEVDGGYVRKKKDNFRKSLDPGAILAQNMQSAQSA